MAELQAEPCSSCGSREWTVSVLYLARRKRFCSDCERKYLAEVEVDEAKHRKGQAA